MTSFERTLARVAALTSLLASLCVPACIGDEEPLPEGGGGLGGLGGEHAQEEGGSAGSFPVNWDEEDTGERATSLRGLRKLSCSIEITRNILSPRIPTVGLVAFTTDLPRPREAVVQFGEGELFEQEAPVDLDQAELRGLLLGMAAETEYRFRVVVFSGQGFCASEVMRLTTGALPAGGPSNVEPLRGPSERAATPGFIVTSAFTTNWVFIMDHLGRIVWSYQPQNGRMTRARLSYDSKFMLVSALNLARTNEAGTLSKIALDGSSEETLNLPRAHHDFTVLPDGGLAYIAQSSASECDSLYYHPPGRIDADEDVEFFTMESAFPLGSDPDEAGPPCHTNSIHYHPEDKSFTASDLTHNAYVKVSAAGEIQWILGSTGSSVSGDALNWERQHGHHLIANDQLLVFNNRRSRTEGSSVFDLIFSPKAGTVRRGSLSYESGNFSSVFGDVQRLPSGNTLITYSVSAGLFHEVDSNNQLVQSIDLPSSTGYSNFRPTLYGPPSR